MNSGQLTITYGDSLRKNVISKELETEIVRKSLHMLVALVPTLAAMNRGITLALLAAGTIIYAYAELLRSRGHAVALIFRITTMASRERDAGGFVLGPMTLGVGAMLALLLYPNPAASIAIYSLAFGDGLSSLAGKMFGVSKIPFTGGKTIVGSSVCFTAVFISAFVVSGSINASLVIAVSVTIIEAMPLGDLDNIILPVSAGLIARIALL